MGSEPGNFRDPHDLYVGGSKGYVYVADRQNNRIQVFDQDGNFIAAWKQFGQPSSVYVDKNDNIYVGATYQDPSRGPVTGPTTGPNDRAIVIGNAITGELKYLIPDPGDLSKMTDTGTSASGIAVDDQGNIYAADVGFNNLRKYIRIAPLARAQEPASPSDSNSPTLVVPRGRRGTTRQSTVGLPHDVVSQSAARLRILALLYAFVFFMAGHLSRSAVPGGSGALPFEFRAVGPWRHRDCGRPGSSPSSSAARACRFRGL